jgi:deoxyadenosine/deoxycytidine kinase
VCHIALVICNVAYVFSGIIGAGKTTLARELGKALDLPVYYEEVIENEYLEDFYADMKKYSFQLQVYRLCFSWILF